MQRKSMSVNKVVEPFLYEVLSDPTQLKLRECKWQEFIVIKLLLNHDERAYSEPNVLLITHTLSHCESECCRAANPQSKTLVQNASCLKELQE